MFNGPQYKKYFWKWFLYYGSFDTPYFFIFGSSSPGTLSERKRLRKCIQFE